MHAKAQHVQQSLDSLGVRTEVRELPASTRTSQDAAEAIGTTVPQIAKSLIFASETELVLVIASGPTRVSVDKIADQLGAEPNQPDAKTVKKQTGFSIGGVPPVGHAAPLTTFVDQGLLKYPEVWAAAGTPNAVFRITPDELVRVTSGKVIDVA